MTTLVSPILMPTWGLSMEEGKLVRWLVPIGAPITPGMEIAEIETTKVTNALEAQASGILRRQIIAEGEIRPCGALIGVVAVADTSDMEIDAFTLGFDDGQDRGDLVSVGVSPEPKALILPDGRSLRYLLWGQGGIPVLLVHGFGGDLDSWQFNHPYIAQNQATYAIDLPGHGGSSKTIVRGDLLELAESLLSALDALGLEQVHLVGHSLGGAVAVRLALDQRERIASLVLIAPAGLDVDIDGDYIRDFIAVKRTRDLQKCLSRLFADPSLVSREMVEQVARNKRLDGAEAALARIAATCFPDGQQRLVLRDDLAKRIAADPSFCVTVVWGEKDSILSPAVLKLLPAGIEARRLPAVGHMPHLEAASEVNAIIAAHLQRAAGRARS